MNIIRDPVDELLKADANAHRDAYIDDAGFTLRVIDRLPAKSRSHTTLRVTIPFGLTVAAAFGALFAGGGNFLVDAAMDIATTNISSAAMALVTIVVVMIAVSVTAVRDS